MSRKTLSACRESPLPRGWTAVGASSSGCSPTPADEKPTINERYKVMKRLLRNAKKYEASQFIIEPAVRIAWPTTGMHLRLEGAPSLKGK